MIFTARQLQEIRQEQNVGFYMTFVDLAEVFDTVSHEGLWKVMAIIDYPAVHSNGAAVPRWCACTGPK